MASTTIWTAKDVIDHLVDFLGSTPTQDARRDARRALLAAYRDFATAHRWSYLYRMGRIVTVASQTTGTIQYVNSTRQLTLTGATWPTWARYGIVRINNVASEVAERTSSTVLTLSVNANPGQDIAAGTSYRIYRDTYPLPSDFIASYENHAESNWGGLDYVHPCEWAAITRLSSSDGTPFAFSITGDENLQGSMAVRFFPAPSSVETIDFMYQRRPKQITTLDYSTGTVATTASDDTVTGTGTTWTSDMEGDIIRILNSTDAAKYPTSLVGSDPSTFERVIKTVTNTTSLDMDATVDTTLSGKNYVVSSPIDIDEGVMFTAFLRLAELQAATTRQMKNIADIRNAYYQALIEAKAADSRFAGHRAVNQHVRRRRWETIPVGADQ